MDVVKGINQDCGQLSSKNALFYIMKENLPNGRYDKLKISCHRKDFDAIAECSNKTNGYECFCNDLTPGTEYNVYRKNFEVF